MSEERSVGREHRLRWTVPATPRPGLPTRKGATGRMTTRYICGWFDSLV